ncbi:MAG: hypothetical protein SVU32_03935, partial [Candidatus Nanohaloarchaea archaeon]|nr:hypothetical protein [Candidatus Nanohaloarchaea archaeon]
NMMISKPRDPYAPDFYGFDHYGPGQTFVKQIAPMHFKEIPDQSGDEAPDPDTKDNSQLTVQEEIQIIRSNMAKLNALKKDQFAQDGVSKGTWSSAKRADSPGECSEIEPGTVVSYSAEGCKAKQTGNCRTSYGYMREEYTGGSVISFEEYCRKLATNVSALRKYYHGAPNSRMYYQQLGYWTTNTTPDDKVDARIPEVYMSSAGVGTRICPKKGMWDAITDLINPTDSHYVSEVDTLAIEFHNVNMQTNRENPNYCYKVKDWESLAQKTMILLGSLALDVIGDALLASGVLAPLAPIFNFITGFGEEWAWQCVNIQGAWPYHGGGPTLSLPDMCTEFKPGAFFTMMGDIFWELWSNKGQVWEAILSLM